MAKKKQPQMSSKTEQKLKNKIIEDKTFGLKNKKKSSKVAKYVQQVQQQVNQAGNRKAMKQEEERKKKLEQKKKEEAKRKTELKEIFKPVQIQQKVPFGVDPKTILCAYFKAGTCQKGNRCKFSHDLNIERKTEKIDLYTDYRGNSGKNKKGKDDETMENWDQSKLESVIDKKFGKDNSQKPTEIVCKYFLEAIETKKYGFFWECPNGGSKCKYRHCLPPGYVLKKKETEEEKRAREAAKENEITLEEFLETERHKLGSNLTPITYESFNKWKAERKLQKEKEEQEKAKARADAYQKYKAGMKSGMGFSGRELFDFNPELANPYDDDDDAMDEYVREDSEDNTENTKESNDKGKEIDVSDMKESISNVEEEIKVNEELFAEEDLEGLDDIDDDEE
ncbi:hypothetical protein BCR36DRAFT_584866 [Piromyces finnis]|uniref:C3H1-type domain-containing protein n=1 Tax=Piromyces finnis TaxID=1754191 RepID=A0A1Y1V4U6_9FUNG|nr:hypothetical protein BCR36DRAFT_584866 [Piromyces finnis]|eukprot:ORX47357.1 hypothetical protein BCR36DRAFT_584866 [Piromyces finnis]